MPNYDLYIFGEIIGEIKGTYVKSGK